MSATLARRRSFVLPLPGWVLHPATALLLAALHVYLGGVHLSKLVTGPVAWEDIWKGSGAMAGAYVFVALASRARAEVRVLAVQRR